MLIDWFTVLAQIANFLILMWLLKHFLYKPVLDAIDAREKRIADLLKETELSQQQAEEQQADLEKKNATFSSEQSNILEEAKIKAESTKQEMLDTAQQEVADKRSRWLSDLQKEQSNLDHDIAKRTQKEVFHVARKALQDLSGVALEKQIIHVFIERMEQLNAQEREQFSANVDDSLIIRSAMTMAEKDQKVLQKALSKVFSTQLPISFEVDEKLVSGIEMLGSGHKLSWNIDEYLSSLEESIVTLVTSKITLDERQASTEEPQASIEVTTNDKSQ